LTDIKLLLKKTENIILKQEIMTRLSTIMLCLVLAYLVKACESRHHHVANRVECLERSAAYLDSKLFDYMYSYLQQQEAVLRAAWSRNAEFVFNHKPVELNEVAYLFDQTGCLNANSSESYKFRKHTSTCPSRLGVNTNKNRWPHYIQEVICTCRTCNVIVNEPPLPEEIYRCMPIMTDVVVLDKIQECDSNGYYKWVGNVTRINAGCTCGVMVNLVPS
jgi:hypothetical protein